MTRLRRPLLVLLTLFAVIQLIRPARNQSVQSVPSDISNSVSIPDTVYRLFKNACFDCHSNNTEYPWYSDIQPVGWLLARDIKNGKAKLNFSELASLSSRRRSSKLQEIKNQIRDDAMPLPLYRLTHQIALLTDEDKERIFTWIENANDSIN